MRTNYFHCVKKFFSSLPLKIKIQRLRGVKLFEVYVSIMLEKSTILGVISMIFFYFFIFYITFTELPTLDCEQVRHFVIG